MEYRAAMVEKKLSASTVNVRLSAVRKLVGEAQRNGIIDASLTRRISRPPSECDVKMRNMEYKLLSVFDHDAEPNIVEALRSAVVQDICWLVNSYSNFDKVTAADLEPEVYKQLTDKYPPLLHFGYFGLPAPRCLANELIWKWTEATGKYTGCQFWSVRARVLFDQEVRSSGGWPITPKLAEDIEKKLKAKTGGGKPKPPDAKLTHEHVYPIKDLKTLLRSKDGTTPESVRQLFDSLCVGCVVLESEHNQLNGHGSRPPWLRYKNAGIRLVDNPAWSDRQRSLILQADILEPSTNTHHPDCRTS
jgi:hypothetical protein